MNRQIGVVSFIFVSYLVWLYLAIYESSIDKWWTVNEVQQITEDTVQTGVSLIRILIGTVIFIVGAYIVILLTRKRR